MTWQAIKSPLEYISQVNHWMLSHDNVWPCTSNSPPGAASCPLLAWLQVLI